MADKCCAKCRYHSRQKRLKVLEVANADLEIMRSEDEPTEAILCRHPKQEGRDMGLIDNNPGDDCALFEEGTKGLSPELEKLLARRGER